MSDVSDLETAVALARAAGDILLEVYAGDFDVEMKGASDPVTDADKRANAFLVEALAKAFPADGIVAEETLDQSAAGNFERCWYVDPLDGTREFIKKNGEFSVMLGLAVGTEARLGVVYQPVGDRLYAGAVGHGAFTEVAGGARRPLTRDAGPEADLRMVVSRSHSSARIDRVRETLPVTATRRSGSVGLKLGLIAANEADIYVHFSDRTCVWDCCGPEAILRAAGGVVTDIRGDAFQYDGRIQNTYGILAGTAEAHALALPVARAELEAAHAGQ